MKKITIHGYSRKRDKIHEFSEKNINKIKKLIIKYLKLTKGTYLIIFKKELKRIENKYKLFKEIDNGGLFHGFEIKIPYQKLAQGITDKEILKEINLIIEELSKNYMYTTVFFSNLMAKLIKEKYGNTIEVKDIQAENLVSYDKLTNECKLDYYIHIWIDFLYTGIDKIEDL